MTDDQIEAQNEYLATNHEIEKLRLEVSRIERSKAYLIQTIKTLEARAKGQRQRATGTVE